MRRLFTAKLMVGYLMVLFGLTLGGMYNPVPSRNFLPFRSIVRDLRNGGQEFVVDLVGNVVFFVPLGWMLPTLLGDRCSARRVAGLSLALSLTVEVAQGVSGLRVADVDDLILNTLGGLVGYGSWLAVDRRETMRGTRRGGPVAPRPPESLARGRS